MCSDDKGRSHQQCQAPFLRKIEFRADSAQITDIIEAVVAGKIRGIAIARDLGDCILYRSLRGVFANGCVGCILLALPQYLGAFAE